jgi:hypothetical protein
MSTGTTNAVMCFVAPGSGSRHGEYRRVEPLLNLVRSLHRTVYVWTVCSVGNDTRHIFASYSDIQWSGGPRDDNAGNLPASKRHS